MRITTLVAACCYCTATITMLACASGRGRGTSLPREILTKEEIATIQVATAYEAVQRLRPSFLRPRGASVQGRTQPVVVYMNHLRLGGPDALHLVRVEEVLEIRFVDGWDATTRYGPGHTSGVIEVVTRARS